MDREFGTYFCGNESAEEHVSLIEGKGIYNPAVKKLVRKDKFGKDSLSFMILGSQDQKKNRLGFFHGFMAFPIQTIWLGLEFQDFKEDDIKSDMSIDDVNFTLVLFFVNKKIPPIPSRNNVKTI